MAALDPLIFRQFPLIQKIIADETWLEGERRGCWVSPDDTVVRENVCQVILRVGAAMRASIEAARPLAPVQLPLDPHSHAPGRHPRAA
jgi:hypothetical protein